MFLKRMLIQVFTEVGFIILSIHFFMILKLFTKYFNIKPFVNRHVAAEVPLIITNYPIYMQTLLSWEISYEKKKKYVNFWVNTSPRPPHTNRLRIHYFIFNSFCNKSIFLLIKHTLLREEVGNQIIISFESFSAMILSRTRYRGEIGIWFIFFSICQN